MKPAAFSYARAGSLAEALSLATAVSRPIAGGQSLGPMLNLRLAQPDALIDIRQLPQLRGHRLQAGRLTIGAAVTHAQIEDGAVPDTTHGMLAAVARTIAYRAVRNRGTIGGSLAHADPAADWVNSLTALQASIHVAGRNGARVVPVAEFIVGAYQTALAPGELVTAIELPAFSPQMRWGYYKICTKVGEFASAIGAVVHDPVLGVANILVGAIEARPLLLAPTAPTAPAAPQLPALMSAAYDDARDALADHLAGVMPQAGEVFVHQHAVALARAIGQMNARAES